MKLIEIKLSDLKPAEGELAIRHLVDNAGIKALSANIDAVGLLAPLLVRKAKENGHYEIVDGNRRYAAIKLLPKWPGSVPCVLEETDSVSVANALSANVMRAEMNPMDRYDAYAKLIAAGLTPGDIAKDFALRKKDVEQILALASLAPSIKDQVRAGKVDMEVAEVLTMVTDHKAQEQFLAGSKGNAWTIRRAIENRMPDLRHAKFKIEAYTEAGGLIAQDLFSDRDNGAKLASTPDIFWKLQTEWLGTQKKKIEAEGWSKLITVSDTHESLPKSYHSSPRADTIKEKQRPFYLRYMTMQTDGMMQLHHFAIPDPAKKAELKEAAGKKPTKADKKAAASEGNEFSQALTDGLGASRNMIVKEGLAATAGTLGARACLYGLLNVSSIGDLRFQERPIIADAKLPLYDKAMEKLKPLHGKKDEALWDLVQKLSDKDVLFAFGMIASWSATAHYGQGKKGSPLVMAVEGIDPRVAFQPSEEFWNRTSKDYMLAELGSIVGKDVAARFKDTKKGALAARMGRLFTNPAKCKGVDLGYTGPDALDPKTIAKLSAWVPAGLRA